MMAVWHRTLAERFDRFPQPQQLLMVINELNRSGNLLDHPQEYRNALERALELLDLLCRDARWRPALRELRRAREKIAEYYVSPAPIDPAPLQNCLLALNAEAWGMVKGSRDDEGRESRVEGLSTLASRPWTLSTLDSLDSGLSGLWTPSPPASVHLTCNL